MKNLDNYKPTSSDIIGVIEVLRALNRYPMYGTKLLDQFTEITHLALTSQIAAILFQIAKHQGTNLHSEELPRISLSHAFLRYVSCSIPDETYSALFGSDPILEKAFNKYVGETAKKLTSPSFALYIFDERKFDDETNLYFVAEALATKAESSLLRGILSDDEFLNLRAKANRALSSYKSWPFIRDILKYLDEYHGKEALSYLFGQVFAELRNVVRWKTRAPLRTHTILGHSFDVGILNYLLVLSENEEDTTLAEQGFYVGLFHDVAEFWTGDIPTPVKDGVPGLRKKTEELEVKMLKEKVFPYLPEWMTGTFESWCLEMIPEEKKDIFKVGDELDAIVEAASQVLCGSSDEYFSTMVKNSTKNPTSPVLADIFNKLRKDAKLT